jgi:predicted MFS family arabinose efflux permease
MLGSQLVVISGCLLIAASAATPVAIRITVAGVGFVATGLARPLFDLPMQTWVSAHVPAADRGRALGVTELGWALSLAATVPVAGVLIEQVGWHSPFLLVAGMAGAGVLALVLTVPRDGGEATTQAVSGGSVARTMVARTWEMPTGLAVCAGAGLAVAAGESVLVVYGEWLTQDFGMSVAQIGASTLLIVAAELIGEGLVVTVSDRIGLRRTLFSALLVSATTYVALGLIGHRVGLAVAVISTLFIAFEVTVVVLIAFASIVVHRSRDRARLLGALMAAVACGNAVGAVLAPLMFAQGGIGFAGAASACTAAAAAAFLWLGSRSNRVAWSLS